MKHFNNIGPQPKKLNQLAQNKNIRKKQEEKIKRQRKINLKKKREDNTIDSKFRITKAAELPKTRQRKGFG